MALSRAWLPAYLALFLFACPGWAQPAPKIIIEHKTYIDQLLAKEWLAHKITPAGKTSDQDFIRRASIDITGRLARPHEVTVFENDPSPDKRARLIDRLLESDDYARHWADLWTAWLMAAPMARPEYRELFHAWIERQLANDIPYNRLMKELVTARGKPENNPATVFLLSHLGQLTPKPFAAKEGQYSMEPATWRTVRFFTCIRIGCARCHDDAFNADLKQKHFWGVNLFFCQVERRAGDELADNLDLNPVHRLFMRRNGVFLPITPAWIDGRRLPGNAGSRREALAELIATDKHFAQAFVNRMWAQFAGRSLTERPLVDDFGPHNPVVHPELLDRLSRDFVAARYDIKQLIRWICNSEAYQLRSEINGTNASPSADVFFSRMQLKELTAEQRLERVLTALHAEKTLTAQQRSAFRQSWLAALHHPEVNDELDYDLCVHYGPAPRHYEAALLMVHRPEIHAALSHPKAGSVARAMQQRKPAEILDELYLTALNRHPTQKEVAWAERELDKLKQKPLDNHPEVWWQDLYFALLNSTEFIFNP